MVGVVTFDFSFEISIIIHFSDGLAIISYIFCIYVGGDGTYLRTSGAIENPDLPILGINTDPSRSTGHLCNQKIYNEKKEKQIENIFD